MKRLGERIEFSGLEKLGKNAYYRLVQRVLAQRVSSREVLHHVWEFPD